jgi:hypothetical protein
MDRKVKLETLCILLALSYLLKYSALNLAQEFLGRTRVSHFPDSISICRERERDKCGDELINNNYTISDAVAVQLKIKYQNSAFAILLQFCRITFHKLKISGLR